jgi:sugar phosphate isomerase/epimerase
MEYIIEDLKSPRIAYWHHTAHSYLQESLGLVAEGAWLGELKDRTAGIHLHDARGIDGYLPPGIGEVDFKLLRESLPQEALRVLDLAPESGREAFRMGIMELRRMGF